jgi:signal transduction histidine kinase
MLSRNSDIYSQKQKWKLGLIVVALLIGGLSLIYTSKLVSKLAEEERKKVELWAEGTRILADPESDMGGLGFILEVIKNNETVPVILADENNNIISYRNFDSLKALDTTYLNEQIALMRSVHEPIEVSLANGKKNFIYYENAIILKQLKYYPFVQLAIIVVFVLVAYFAFSSSRRAEQNRVWVGMAKETAHQLGTPLSSMMAWIEILKTKGVEKSITDEFEKDIERLNTITERFSKIGSLPQLNAVNLGEVLQNSINYMRTRSPRKVIYSFNWMANQQISVLINIPLFEWAIENLCKNAVDAMEASGKIDVVVSLSEKEDEVYIDFSDTGKGITKSKFKTIFNPGYTSKKKGWGLGLTLVKRIIEEYHKGKIFVKDSKINEGTTFRIVLKQV